MPRWKHIGGKKRAPERPHDVDYKTGERMRRSKIAPVLGEGKKKNTEEKEHNLLKPETLKALAVSVQCSFLQSIWKYSEVSCEPDGDGSGG